MIKYICLNFNNFNWICTVLYNIGTYNDEYSMARFTKCHNRKRFIFIYTLKLKLNLSGPVKTLKDFQFIFKKIEID